jgi:elongation factor P hydroxylase
MRKQYSFWPGKDGLDAWDVDRLVALSADLPIEEVDVASIGAVDTVYWFGPSGEEATVRGVVEHVRLINEVDLSHPIILGADGRVMDGMHRVAKAILEGRETIRAVRFCVQPEPDYRNCKPDELPY